MEQKKNLTPEQRRDRILALAKLPLTIEEKNRWEPMLHDTWQAIGSDVEQAMKEDRQKLTRSIIVECVLDANRVQMYGDMTDEEYAFLCVCSHRSSVARWLRATLNY